MRACSREQVLSFPKGDALQKATFDVLRFNMIASFTFSHFLCLCPQKLVNILNLNISIWCILSSTEVSKKGQIHDKFSKPIRMARGPPILGLDKQFYTKMRPQTFVLSSRFFSYYKHR